METEEATNAELVPKKSRAKDDDEDDYDWRSVNSEASTRRTLNIGN